MNLNIDTTLQRDNFLMNINHEFCENITGIFGHSGAGKTSLIHLISGLAITGKGTIVLNGKTLLDSSKKIFVPPKARKIGVVFQDSRLFPHMTVEKNLLFGQRFLSGNKRKIRFEDVVETLELSSLLKSYPAKISGGEGRRVAIGRALLAEPELILLDEPFSAIDSGLRGNILRFIRRISTKLNIPMIIISHSLHDLLSLTDNLILLKGGQIVGAGKFVDLVSDSQVGELIRKKGMLNMLPGMQEKLNKDITILKPLGSSDISIKAIVNPVIVDKRVKMTIEPSDIIISIDKENKTSASNNIPATVTKLIKTNHDLICCLSLSDGVILLAEITHGSKKRLNIDVGTKCFCIFKTTAVNYF